MPKRWQRPSSDRQSSKLSRCVSLLGECCREVSVLTHELVLCVHGFPPVVGVIPLESNVLDHRVVDLAAVCTVHPEPAEDEGSSVDVLLNGTHLMRRVSDVTLVKGACLVTTKPSPVTFGARSHSWTGVTSSAEEKSKSSRFTKAWSAAGSVKDGASAIDLGPPSCGTGDAPRPHHRSP